MSMQIYLAIIAFASLPDIAASTNVGFVPSDRVVGRLEKVFCNINPKYGNVTCKIKAKSRHDVSIYISVRLVRTVTALKHHSKGYYQFSNNEYRPMLLDIKTDYCAVQAGIMSSVFQNAIKEAARNKTNAFRTCPIPPGEYYLRDYNFQATDLPNVIPAGRYLVKSSYFVEADELAGSSSIYFRIENHGILDLNVG